MLGKCQYCGEKFPPADIKHECKPKPKETSDVPKKD